jgi:hypothetical protein
LLRLILTGPDVKLPEERMYNLNWLVMAIIPIRRAIVFKTCLNAVDKERLGVGLRIRL